MKLVQTTMSCILLLLIVLSLKVDGQDAQFKISGMFMVSQVNASERQDTDVLI